MIRAALLKLTVSSFLIVSLTSCGGGGGSSGTSMDPGGDPTSGTSITGTGAAGAPIIGTVTVKGSLGNTNSTLIEADGTYDVDVTGLTAPYRLRAAGTVGGRIYKLHSYTETAVEGGNVNITPFTDLIVANAAGQIAESYFDSNTPVDLDPAELDAQEAALQAKLQTVFSALGISTAIDLLYSIFSADHSGLDAALDIIRIEIDPGLQIATITNLLEDTTLDDSVTDPDDNMSSLTVINPDALTEGVSDIQGIVGIFDALTAAFASGLPTAASIEDLFSIDFYDEDISLGPWLTDFATDPRLIGLTFRSVSISDLDSTTGTATVTFNVSFNGVTEAVPETWLFARDNVLGWQARGDQRIVDAYFNFHCNDKGIYFLGGCGVNTRFFDEDFSNNGTMNAPIASGTVSIVDGTDMTVKHVIYLGTPDFAPPGELQVYNQATGQFQGDHMGFGTGVGEIDPAIFVAGDTIQYDLYTQDLDVSTPASPQVATGSEIATYTDPLLFAPSLVALYPDATSATFSAMADFTPGDDLTIAWVLAAGTGNSEVLVEMSDNRGNRIEIWTDTFADVETSLTVGAPALNYAAAADAGLDQAASTYNLLVRIYAQDLVTGQAYSRDYTAAVPGPGTEDPPPGPFLPLSYAVSATDIIGDTGSSAVALGVPDYAFVNDAGLGFGGTSTDVFDVGEVVELAFPTALRNHPDQHDLVISAFVEGLGGTDNATVQVEASSDGSLFTIIDTFDTEEARDYPPPNHWENDFRAVKHFPVEFGAAQKVTHIRLTNLAGTSEGLRLDAVEGLHPVTNSAYAFEVRIERVRPDLVQRFKIRIKNISDPSGVPIREWAMDQSGSLGQLEETTWPIEAVDGDFICITNCVPDNHPDSIPFSNHVWSVDESTEAAPGLGLDPGRQAANARFADFDTDGGIAYLSAFKFTVTFADGFTHTFDYDADVTKELGSLYQKYLYFDDTPLESWNRPVDYYQFVRTVNPVNDVPIANADADSTDEDTAFTTLDVLSNDSDGGDGPGALSITAFDATSANGGSVSYNGNGTFDYTPAANFNGDDTFTYTVSDTIGTAVGTVTITVNPVNNVPVANADTDSTDEDTAFTTLDVLSNDTDGGDGPGALSITAFDATSANGGSVSDNGNGTFDYTPAANFNGDDTFTYTVSDTAGSSVGTVTITVNSINDNPVANDDSESVFMNAMVITNDVLANDTDVENDTLTVAAGDPTDAVNGIVINNNDGTFDYTPNPDFVGSDSFTYTVNDGNGGSDIGTVNITVIPPTEETVAILLDATLGGGVGHIDSWNNNLPQFEYWRNSYDTTTGTLSLVDEEYDYATEIFVDVSGFDSHWLTPMGTWELPSSIDVITPDDGDGSMVVGVRDAGDTENVANFRIRAFTQDIDGDLISDYLDANWVAQMLNPAATFGAGAQLVTSYTFESLTDSYSFELEDWCESEDPARYAALGNSCNGVFINTTASYATSLIELQVATAWIDTETTDDSGLDAVIVSHDESTNSELLAELLLTANEVNFYVRDYDLTGANYIIKQTETSTWSLDSVSGVMMIRFSIPATLQSQFPDLGDDGALNPFFAEYVGFVRGGVLKPTGLVTADNNILNGIALDEVLANFDAPTAPEFTELIGTWVSDSTSATYGDPTVFHYFSSYHYEVSGTCDGDGTTGLEYGTMTVDGGDGTFTTNTSVNGRGLCSFTDSAGPGTTLSVNGDMLTLDSSGQVSTFSRLKGENSSPLVGSWVAGDITMGGDGHALLTFFDDTTYMHSEDCTNPDVAGTEYGSYSWDEGGTDQVMSSQVYDANGINPGCGLSENISGDWEFAVAGNTLTVTDSLGNDAIFTRHSPAFVPLLSYAVSATDIVGNTGSSAVALGVPDYAFVNDTGLGFGGTSTDVFDVNEVVELGFPTALRNHPDQHDLVISAFVEGLGGTDNATVQVEASSDGSLFTIIDTFNTDEARSYPPPNQWENDFRAVKHFFVEFGAAQNVTHIRLTNLAGTSEGLRLDAVEGLHPVVNSAHAFEVRIERVREDIASRFKIRMKNISDPTGVPIREWTMDRSNSLSRLQETTWPIEAVDGDFICVTNCVPDNHPVLIPFSHHVWSVDGSTEAAPGMGLDPGRQAANARYADFDTDPGPSGAYLDAFKFTVTFADGFTHTFDYDADVTKEIGSLYQQYLYFASTPAQSWNRPVDYYQFVD